MNPEVFGHLRALYGDAMAHRTVARMERLLEAYTSRLPPPADARGRLALTQRDALLITYADQVREPGVSPLGTLAGFAARRLLGLISGIHLLPFYPWSSDDGFAVKDFFAVAPEFGTWDDWARLGADFDLMLDAVFNHVSAEGEWFQRFLAGDARFRDFFIAIEGEPDLSRVIRPRALPLLTGFPSAAGPVKVWTTFSADQADLNFKNPEVLLAVLDALLFYVAKGARFVRLDAVAFLWKEIGTTCLHLAQTHRLIQLLRAVLDHVAAQVLLITETNVPHADNVSYFGDGRNEAQLVYNFALPPLVLHSFQTGNTERLTTWAQSLRLPSDGVTFFNFLASHDGIGLNPARGILSENEVEAVVHRVLAHGGFVSYRHAPGGNESPYEMNINFLDALSNPSDSEPDERAARKLLTAHAIMLSLQGMPGIYFHSLFGSRGDRAGALASGINRRINREKLDRARLEAELADDLSLRARVFRGWRNLLQLRCAHAAFAPTGRQTVLGVDSRLFALVRESLEPRDRVLCLHNVSPQEVKARLSDWGAGEISVPAWSFRWLPLP